MTLLDTLRGLLEKRIAFVFPGQGSQRVGMGWDLYQNSPAARRIFDQADDALGFSLSKLCFEGPNEDLSDTVNAQPAILTVSVAYLEALREHLDQWGAFVQPVFVAGHSLGQYSALVAARVLDFRNALLLVRERGRLMKEAAEHIPGGMAAVIGLDAEKLAAVCQKASALGKIHIANDNCPGELVISGEEAALQRAIRLAKETGARAVIRLAVSIASHSPLMDRVASALDQVFREVSFQPPQIPIVSDITGNMLLNVEDIRRELARQVSSPVIWRQSVLGMIDRGAEAFLEIGPGKVLSGLIRRIRRDVPVLPVGTMSFGDVQAVGAEGL